jgi:hypothetical protein
MPTSLSEFFNGLLRVDELKKEQNYMRNKVFLRKCRIIGLVVFMSGLCLDLRSQVKNDIISTASERADQIKNPGTRFSWGADIRFRQELTRNQYLTKADPPGYIYNFERMRLRQWNTFKPFQWLDINWRLVWEGKYYWKPDSKSGLDRSEIVFDNLNCKLKFCKIPLTLTIGRQDIVFGDGWLVSEGTPLDGPRTTYFEAIRATFDMKSVKSICDLIYIDQTSSPDYRLPPIFSQKKPLMEQNERGAILNFSYRMIAHNQLDPYFLYKHDDVVLTNGDNGDIYIVGCRIDHDFNKKLICHADGAYQFGERKNVVMFHDNESRLSAFGFNCRLTYNFCDSLQNQLLSGYSVLSGSDANSTHNHQFDPLWGRWAQYSELFPNEFDRPGERSNVHRVNFGHQVAPNSKMFVQTNYQAIFAYANRYLGTKGFSNTGKFKGQLITLLLKYQCNRYWSFLFLGECFIPGNYYETPSDGTLCTRNDPAAFFRVQSYFTF